MFRQTWMGGVAVGVMALVVTVALPVDIRPEAVVGLEREGERRDRAVRIVERGMVAQGAEAFAAAGRLSFELQDEWHWTSFRLYMPLSDDEVRLSAEIELHDYLRSSSWAVLDGSGAGARFGVDGGVPWKQSVDGARSKAGIGVEFYAPTMEFLSTLAFHVGQAEILSWVDEVERDGVTYDRVLATWRSPSATMSVDQYVLYYRKDTGRLEQMECTIRDFGPFITGAVRYDAWTQVTPDLWLPGQFTMTLWDLDGPDVHTVTLHDVGVEPTAP